MLNEALSRKIYHFTTIANAFHIMKSNTMNMSKTDPGTTDDKLSHNRLFYLSTTTNGNILTSQYPQQMNRKNIGYLKLLVRFCLDGDSFKHDGIFGKPVDFMKEKAKRLTQMKPGSKKKSDIANVNFFKELGLPDNYTQSDLNRIVRKANTDEERLASDKPIIPNFIKYVRFVDVLADTDFDNKLDPIKIATTLSEVGNNWVGKIRIFLSVEDFNSNGTWYSIEEILENNKTDNDELELTDTEIKQLKGSDKSRITTNGLKQLSMAIYTIAVTQDGLETTKNIARGLMSSYGLDCEIIIEDTKNKQIQRIGILSDEVIDNFDDIDKTLKSKDAIGMSLSMKQAFRTFSDYAYECKFVNIALLQMYSDWLKKYTKNVKAVVNKIKQQLNSMSFDELFNYMTEYFDIFKNMIETVLGRKVSYSTIKLSAKAIGKWLYKLKGKSILIDYFIKSYKNEKYHYDELCFFKRSVILYKNRLINKLRGDERVTRMGDMAVLYNNAGKANDKMQN